jgi:hypothetical protein
MTQTASPPPRRHTITMQAVESDAPWAEKGRLENLRYQKTGWWIDWLLPHGPIAFLVVAIALPLALWGLGLALAPDTHAYLTTHDMIGQAPFLTIHFLCLRVCGSLFARGLTPSLEGLGIDPDERRHVARGLFGWGGNLGGLACAALFILRDTWMGTVADPTTGLTAFTDPARWNFGALGTRVNMLQLAMWNIEWIMFGFLLWVQIWILVGMDRAVRRTHFEPHLARLLVKDEYRDFFSLVGRNASVCLIFALANLVYIHFTGELFPRNTARITGVWSFMTEMSDLLSTALLFAILVLSFWWHVAHIRRALTAAVNRVFAEAGDAALEEMETPLKLDGHTEVDLERVRSRLDASSGLLRAVVFQREVDALGTHSLNLMFLKAVVPLGTVAMRILKMAKGGGE